MRSLCGRCRLVAGVLNVRVIALLLILLSVQAGGGLIAQETPDPVFSGPQAGESLPPLPVEILTGEEAGEKVDLLERFDGKPSVIFFIHQLTRPGFGLMRTISDFASSRTLVPSDNREANASREKLPVAVVFLTADKTETIQWAGNVKRLFNESVLYGVSPDGIEGPGAFGLNRNVTLTVLVCDQSKVIKNFALVQPQLQADGPAMLEAIVKVTGGGEVPSLDQLVSDGRGMMRQRPDADPSMQRRSAGDTPARSADRSGEAQGRDGMTPELTSQLRGLISKTADESQVKQRAEEIERYLEEHPEGKKEIARIVNTIIGAGKLENYGTPAAQRVLTRWKDKYREFAPRVNRSETSAEKQPSRD